jgi:tetratricopeptide (TPR) repeat protein
MKHAARVAVLVPTVLALFLVAAPLGADHSQHPHGSVQPHSTAPASAAEGAQPPQGTAPADAMDHAHHDHAAPAKLGTVRFPSSCNSAAQPAVERGVALLHSFAYASATQAFAQAAELDPACAMAPWGVAMSWLHPIWAPPTAEELAAGRAAALRATELAAGETTTARERSYVAAIAAFHRDADTLDHRTRLRAFEGALRQTAADHPDDDEAAIFHALAILGVAYNSPHDPTFALQRQAAAILDGLLPRHPDHPGIAHYMIHSFDYPEVAELALPAARAYAAIAPDAPHALHMPSHIFVRLGLWDETIASNLDSARVADRQTVVSHPGATAFDALHAIDYLVYGYLQTGRHGEAKKLLDRVNAVTALDQGQFAAAYALAAVPARYALELRDWSTAAALPDPPAVLPWERFPYALALVDFGRAVGAARAGDLDRARPAVARLAALHQQLAAAPRAGFDWASQVEVQHLAAAGWLAQAEGNAAEARRLLRAAADLEDSISKHPVTPGSLLPAREMLADLELDLGEPATALAEYEASLRTAPKRYNTIAGAVRAAEALGDEGKVKALRGELEALVGGGGAEDAVETSPTTR